MKLPKVNVLQHISKEALLFFSIGSAIAASLDSSRNFLGAYIGAFAVAMLLWHIVVWIRDITNHKERERDNTNVNIESIKSLAATFHTLYALGESARKRNVSKASVALDAETLASILGYSLLTTTAVINHHPQVKHLFLQLANSIKPTKDASPGADESLKALKCFLADDERETFAEALLLSPLSVLKEIGKTMTINDESGDKDADKFSEFVAEELFTKPNKKDGKAKKDKTNKH